MDTVPRRNTSEIHFVNKLRPLLMVSVFVCVRTRTCVHAQ